VSQKRDGERQLRRRNLVERGDLLRPVFLVDAGQMG